ncbi:MAG: RNA methyltransferase [Tannerella sp.]|jgi:TrmH family RNA methyltransferase|nr:RNA methyltransferase [Tannerella sp.]
MLSKAKIKEIRALEMKKIRDEQNLFVAEGNKLVADMLHAFECEWLIAHTSWMATQGDIPAKELILAEENDIRKVSFLKTPQDVLAVFKKPQYLLEEANPVSQLIIALDSIQDPGNLGTIIRLAGWFGIKHIVCSPDTADAFSPKTVQATMGALAHVNIHYTNLDEYIEKNKTSPVYGTFLDGENIYKKKLSRNGIIIMGNEGKGIRPEIETLISERLYIPPYPPGQTTTESLNVATATAIICAEFRRVAAEKNIS